MLVMETCGFLGNDAEIKEFNGKRYISFNVAASNRHKDANGTVVNRTTWVSCLKLGEGALATYLKKGTQVFIRGDLSTKIFTNANGAQVGINCHVRELQLLSGGSKTQTDGNASATSIRSNGSTSEREERRFTILSHAYGIEIQSTDYGRFGLRYAKSVYTRLYSRPSKQRKAQDNGQTLQKY